MLKPVGNEDIYKETEKANNRVWAWIKKNWKAVIFYSIIVFQIASLIFGKNGWSWAFGIKSGGDSVKIELNDFDIDSSNQMEDVDIFSYVPKTPKYFVIHCSGSKDDQTEEDLWKVFRERFSNGKSGYNYCIKKDGSIISLAPIDNSPYLEYREIVNGVKNLNSICVSIGITGNRDKNEITQEQLNTLRYMFVSMRQRFPNLILTTHRELISKDYNHNGRIDPIERVKECPRFDHDTYFF